MILKNDLLLENIFVNPGVEDRWELIDYVINSAVKNNYINPDFKIIIRDALFDREKTMSTGIGNCIAVPHCRCNCVEDIKIFLCISKDGIEFESLDGSPAKVVVFFIVPESKKSGHVNNLAMIARLFMNEDFKNNLILQENPLNVLEFLKTNIKD